MKTKNKQKSSERGHHPFSPSKLAYLEACPCYESRESKHDRTVAGTMAHKVVETGRDDLRLSDDDAAASAECLDFVDTRRRLMQAQADAHCRAVNGNPEKFKIREIKEAYLPVDDIEFPGGIKSTTAGYIDHVLISWDRKYAELVDYKFGLWPVDAAKDNLQGLAYLVGLFKKIPKLEKVKIFFKQPHLQVTTEAEFTRTDIPAIYLRIQTVVARAREARSQGNFGMATPRVPACSFCANLGKCPKVCELACKVGNKFYPLEIPENITPTMVLGTRDTTLSLRLAQVVAVWADSFKKQLNDRVLRGEAPVPPGYALTSRQDREIVDKNRFQGVAERFVRPSEYLECCTPSFTAVEKIISDRADRGQKKATVEEFGKELLEAGAVQLGQPYAFLRAVPSKTE